jgi:AraC-like DNA-binding protein
MKALLEPVYRTRVQSIAGIDELARELGQDLEPLLLRCGLTPAIMAQADAYISYSVMCDLMEACALQWNCPDLGLRMARAQNWNILGPVGLAVRLATTVEQAMAKLADHMAIHSTGFRTYVKQDAVGGVRRASLVFVVKPGAGAGRQVIEHSLYVARNILSMLAGTRTFKPASVSFQHGAPPNAAAVRRAFECPILYHEEINAVHFDADVLRAPNVMCDPSYAPMIEAYFEKLRPQFEVDLVQAVRNMIGNLISTGKCSLVGAAECYGVHPRTLQRHLQAKDVSFAEILDDYRKTLALDLVARRAMPLVKIGDVLGYADQSTFNQAFRRWTGTTPTRFAAQASAGAANRVG